MMITTLLASLVAVKIWHWSPWLAGLVTAAFLVPDLAFFGAAMVKIPDGGWFPLAVAFLVLGLLASWEQGRSVLSAALAERLLPTEAVLDDIARSGIQRTPGTAVYLTSDETSTPIALLHNLKINRVVHERNIFLALRGEEVPDVAAAERFEETRTVPFALRIESTHFAPRPATATTRPASRGLALGDRRVLGQRRDRQRRVPPARRRRGAISASRACGRWLLAAVAVLLLVLCFAEASSYFDQAGRRYLYTRTAFGDLVGFEVGWMTWIARVATVASLSVGFAQAMGYLLPGRPTRAGRARWRSPLRWSCSR